MKDFRRDVAIIRQVLLRLESGESLDDIADADSLRYHLRLMIESDLLRGRIDSSLDGYSIWISKPALTNAAHDLLATIRADTLWQRITARLMPLAGTVTLELLTEVAKSEGRKLLGLSNQ